MAKKIDYASLFTFRKDGRYMGYWHEPDAEGNPTGPRHAIYDRDPEKLYRKIEEKEQAGNRAATFAAAAESWEGEYRQTVTDRTWNNFRPHYEALVDKWGKLPIEDITAALITADLQQAKAKGLSRTVVNGRKVIITGILNKALADGLIPFNPALSVRLPKGLKSGKRSAPSDDAVDIVLRGVDKPFGIFPFLLLCTGMRKSEALALLRSDVDFDNRLIYITKALTYIDNANPSVKDPKSKSGHRAVPIIDVLEQPLRDYCKTLSGDILFPQPPSNRAGKAGGYMSERAYEGAWERYCKEAGLADASGNPQITAHQLRHGTATLLFESGVDAYTAQRILGHANVQTTMTIYTELRNKQMKKSVEKFDSAMSELLSSLKKRDK